MTNQGDMALTQLDKQPKTLVGLDSEKRLAFFNQFADQFAAVSAGIKPERIIQLAVLSTSQKAIAECDLRTVIGTLMEATTLGFEPVNSLNQCALVPFNDRKNNRKVLTLQIMYQGYIDLAYRSGLVKDVYGDVVREGDELDFRKGTDGYIHHIPNPIAYDQNISHAYTVAHFTNGGYIFEIWPVQKIIAHRNRYARGYERSDSPWKTAFDQMCMKSVMKQMMKFVPKSIEYRRAEVADENIIEYDHRSQKLIVDNHGQTMEQDVNTEEKQDEKGS